MIRKLILCILLEIINSKCAFTEDCTDPRNPATCGIPYKKEYEP